MAIVMFGLVQVLAIMALGTLGNVLWTKFGA